MFFPSDTDSLLFAYIPGCIWCSLKTFFIPPFSVFYYIILVHFFIIYPLVEHCIAVKQTRLAKVITDFAKTLDAEIADALGFYSVEDFYKFFEERKTEEE